MTPIEIECALHHYYRTDGEFIRPKLPAMIEARAKLTRLGVLEALDPPQDGQTHRLSFFGMKYISALKAVEIERGND